MILLSGEAGIGKSRIAEALVDALRGEPHFLLRYQCSPYHVDSTLYPAIQQITSAPSALPRTTRHGSPPWTGWRRCSPKPAAISAEVAPLLATSLGIEGESRYGTLTLPPQQRRNRTLAVLIDQLSGACARSAGAVGASRTHIGSIRRRLELIELALDRVRGHECAHADHRAPDFCRRLRQPSGRHAAGAQPAWSRGRRQSIIDAHRPRQALAGARWSTRSPRGPMACPLFVEEMTKAVIERRAAGERGRVLPGRPY